MEQVRSTQHTIWGKWWLPIRKWFYPSWLVYEASVRFYEYALFTHQYFAAHKQDLAAYTGDIGAQMLDVSCSASVFMICTFFLTVPASLLLYKFFNVCHLTETRWEQKLKPFF